MALGASVISAAIFAALYPVLRHMDIDLDMDFYVELFNAATQSLTSMPWPSIFSMSFPSLSGNEVSGEACCVGSSYHYVYYYYAYPQYARDDSQPACLCSYGSSHDVPMWPWSWQPFVLVWCLSFFVMLCIVSNVGWLLWRRVTDTVRFMLRPLGALRPVALACVSDAQEAWLACLFAWCAVALILSRRLPWCKQCLRRHALRHRPYTAAHIASGDPMSPPGSSRSARRPLVAIQMDQQALQACDRLLQGGRWAGGRRIPQHRLLRWRTQYNPSSATGDCLFLTMSKLMRYSVSSLCMRKEISDHAVLLLASGARVLPGLSLQQLLDQHHIDPVAYFARLANQEHLRWGNSIDVVVASHLYDIRFRIIDLDSLRVVLDVDAGCAPEGRPSLDIGYRAHHFVGGVLAPSRRTRCVNCQLLAGGALRVHAGTSQPEDPYARPFEVVGMGMDGSHHVIRNGQDCAILTAAHVISSRTRHREVPPAPRDILDGLSGIDPVSYTHLRAHETEADL
eukprot:742623-Amphidinium_carterae.1